MKKLFIIFFVLLFSTNAYALKFVDCYKTESKDTSSYKEVSFTKKSFEKYEFIFYPKQNKVSRVIVKTDYFLEVLKSSWEKQRVEHKKKYPNDDLGSFNHERISNDIFNITLYDETYIKAKRLEQSKFSSLLSTLEKLVFNLQDGWVEVNNDIQVSGSTGVVTNTFFKCQIKKNKSQSNYLDYWWAVILIIAITFFIFTQSGKRLKKIRRK